ncbi:hypothetical protein RRF57_011327 [Xylaria bambusicola]|uniref:Uncharacterized protein n=1 Tax=Xylaria bambusicola TaxID=326684 RepID=A0AAN7Z3J7_9PEZI
MSFSMAQNFVLLAGRGVVQSSRSGGEANGQEIVSITHGGWPSCSEVDTRQSVIPIFARRPDDSKSSAMTASVVYDGVGRTEWRY